MRTFIPQKQQNKAHSPTSVPPVVREALASPGQPLDAATRAWMEPRFGHDFGRVRVHADAKAAESAEAVQARAYTVGRDVVFGGGRPSLDSAGGRLLLAHELAHVVQQSRGGQAPAVHPSAPHERDAEAAATAVVAGQASVPVHQSTGIGVARQPKEKASGTDINIGDILTLPNVTDPRSSPRYIDKLFQRVTYSGFTGASVFQWKENGKDQKVGVPLVDLEQDDTRSFVPILDIYNSKAEALKAIEGYASAGGTQFKFYTFYRTADNVIMPTCFSIHSTPEFHKLWPGLKKGLAEDATDIRQGLVPLANTVNPIPFTQVDEHGSLSGTADPLSVVKLGRLKDLKRLWRARFRRHSGHGVKYTVHGPHDKLQGTSVYVLKDAQGEILYVGKGEALDRLREHIKDPNKTQWFGEIAEVEVRATGLNNTQALALEETLIGQLSPLHNKDLYPFHKEFGNQLALGPNLPKAQKSLRFFIEWGH